MNYYIEGERVCTKIGGHFSYAPTPPLNNPLPFISGDVTNFKKKLRIMVDRGIECSEFNPDYVTIDPYLGVMHRKSMMLETNLYFYHSDHLGSSSFITNKNGLASQHFQPACRSFGAGRYMPYGEPFVEQKITSTYYTPYKFSGKEKDNETQYSYFGARYYDSDLSVWLSVDPLSDKYPNLSPYAYCANNPVMLKDPDGNKIIIALPNANARDLVHSKITVVFAPQVVGARNSQRLNTYIDNSGQVQYTNKQQAAKAIVQIGRQARRAANNGQNVDSYNQVLKTNALILSDNTVTIQPESNQPSASGAITISQTAIDNCENFKKCDGTPSETTVGSEFQLQFDKILDQLPDNVTQTSQNTQSNQTQSWPTQKQSKRERDRVLNKTNPEKGKHHKQIIH